MNPTGILLACLVSIQLIMYLISLRISSLILDIDECATENGGCKQRCHNYESGYLCSCRIGYELMEDQKSCTRKAVTNVLCYLFKCNINILRIYLLY